ncbi:MAG: epoxyqueuosine reductase QueH [Campylobacteraceae bacterium]|nr:epoxyqueuosine reductase QueH [Campylobacteraceae bacterium]
MLIHICCSVDSHYFLSRLRELYPKASLRGFFYNPNIHPKEEYDLRLMDVKRSCEKLKIPLDEGEYKLDSWEKSIKGLEHIPERGARCTVCFKERLEETAKHAIILGEKEITTTLLMSPQKSFEQLKNVAKNIEKRSEVKFIFEDFRSSGGTQAQFALAKKEGLYHQNYCGCIYALLAQRQKQREPAVELSSYINRQILPGSIVEKELLYKHNLPKRRQGFLNYRLHKAAFSEDKKVLPSYVLFYSLPSRKVIKSHWELLEEGVAWSSKGPLIALSLEKFNALSKVKYESIGALFKNPPLVEEELKIRVKLEGEIYSLTPIIILESLPKGKTLFECDAEIFQDVRELLARLS